MTLEEIVIEMRELSERLRELTEALALIELQTAAATFSTDQLRQSARRFLSKPLTDSERQYIRENTGITLEGDYNRRQALAVLMDEATG